MTDYNADTCCNYAACPCPMSEMPALQTGTGWRTPNEDDPGGICCICDWQAQKTSEEPHKLTCYQQAVDIEDPLTGEVIATECYQENCCGVECDPEAGGQAGEWEEIIDENGCLTGRNWIAADPACAKPESPDWISEICSCGCLIKLEAGEDDPCEEAGKVFQEGSCECKCEKTNDDCESGEVVDEDTCECVPCEVQPEDCVELEEYNGEKCQCECAENPCEATPATPDFVAPCSCDCIEIECDAGFYFVSNEEYCGCEPCGLECEGDKVPNEDCTECTGCPKKTDMVLTYTDPNDGQEKTHCCPEGTEVCFDDSIFGPAPGTGAPICLEPCPKGVERGAGPDSPCGCKCPNEGTVFCGGVCRPECSGYLDYRHPAWDCACACGINESGQLGQSCGSECIFCPEGKELNTSTCECECGPGLEEVNCDTVNECREPCPEGETRQSVAMGTNCGCHKCGDYDPDSCGNNSTYSVFHCECVCDKGYELCDGECYEKCRYPFRLKENEPPFGGCSCQCQNDGFLGGVNKVYCENSNGGQATCVDPCPSHLTLNQANCECECEDSNQEECCIPGVVEDSCSCVDKCVPPLVRTIDGVGGVSCKCKCPDPENQVVCGEDCLQKCPDGQSFDENCDCQDDYGSSSWLKSMIP